jgi:small-conductance mechanosensitive channel
MVICLKLIIDRKENFITIPESPATKALLIFTLTQVVLSIVLNITGRVTLAKIFGISAIQGLLLGITLKVFSTMALEAIYLQSEAYAKSRFSDFINFKELQTKLKRILWITASIIWTVSLIRSLTMYDAMLSILSNFFNEQRSIGNMIFTFKSVAVFICIIWISSFISTILNFFFGNQSLSDSGKRNKVGSMMLLIRLAVWTIGFLIAVAAAGIPLDKLSLMIGALGVGIGFGLQNIVNNLVSGIILAFERPIQVGDLIEIGNKSGTVKEIGVRSSKIKSADGADIIVPNGDLLSQHLINWTMQDNRKRIEFMIAIPYSTDIEMVKSLIQEQLKKNEAILQEPDPHAIVHAFTDQAIEIKILCWVPDLTKAGTVRSNLMIDICEALIAAGVQLQLPPK